MAGSGHDAAGATSAIPTGAWRRGGTPLLLGVLLAVCGLLGVLEALGVVPAGVSAEVRGWWPVLLVAGGATLVVDGRHAAGVVVAVLGAGLLAVLQLPGALALPLLLIAVGGGILVVAFTGRRWPTVAMLEDIETRVAGGEGQRRLVAVFSDVDAAVDDPAERVECLALFGAVRLAVPGHLPVVVDEIAVFGDVDGPAPASADPGAVLHVAATAVFGDVKIRRR